MIKVLLSLSLLLGAELVLSTEVTVSNKQVVKIEGVIVNQSFLQSKQSRLLYPELFLKSRKMANMDEVNEKFTRLVRMGNKQITVLINSPGGLVSAGTSFINLMHEAKSYGITVTCVVNGRAMSMALAIFTSCEHRMATFGSVLMWHSVSQNLYQRFTEQISEDLHQYLKEVNEELWAPLKKFFSKEYFDKHFEAETFLHATELARTNPQFLKVIDNIIVKKD